MTSRAPLGGERAGNRSRSEPLSVEHAPRRRVQAEEEAGSTCPQRVSVYGKIDVRLFGKQLQRRSDDAFRFTSTLINAPLGVAAQTASLTRGKGRRRRAEWRYEQ